MNRVYNLETKDLRNRSSKNLMLIQKVKPAVRSMSNEQLKKLAYDKEASKEIERRARKNAKKNSK